MDCKLSFLTKVLLGGYKLGFTFWVMGFIVPTPIFLSKYFLKEAGVFVNENTAIYIFGQIFLWAEWLYFVFITIAIWNSAKNYIRNKEKYLLFGYFAQALSLISGILAIGSFANQSGITEIFFGQPIFLGMSGRHPCHRLFRKSIRYN